MDFKRHEIKVSGIVHDFLACPNYKVKQLHLSYYESDHSVSYTEHRRDFVLILQWEKQGKSNY